LPDVAAEAAKALDAAHLQALNQIFQSTSVVDWKNELIKIQVELERKQLFAKKQ
jgi:hypothetical protein